MKNYWIYIMSNKSRTVYYIGVTNDIQRRTFEHKTLTGSTFASNFNCTQLLYSDEFNNINDAITQEKRLKKWKRSWKDKLIKENNPNFIDLAGDWFEPEDIKASRFLPSQE